MDIAALKQEARSLEQQGRVDDALEVYRQALAELEAIGGLRQELPLLIKIGDLLAKSDDADGAVQMYERAAAEYAQQGAAQPVISLCDKILRENPQETGAYLRLARRMLDAGHIEGTREVLIDYARRGGLDRTREGLEKLAGRPDADVRRLLDKAIFTGERRLARRGPPTPRPPGPGRSVRGAAPAAPPAPAPEEEPPAPPDVEPEPEAEPEPEPELPGPPKKRLTVPVGALDAEPTSDLLQTRPPEPSPEDAFPTAEELAQPVAEPPAEPLEPPAEALDARPPRESRPQDAFPTAEELQAPALSPAPAPPPPPPSAAPSPEAPPVEAELPQPPSPELPPLLIEHDVPQPPPIELGTPQPLQMDSSLAPLPRGSEPALERPEPPPETPIWAPNHAGARHEAPPPQEPAPPPPPPRVSRQEPRVSRQEPRVSRQEPRVSRPAPPPSRAARTSVATRTPRRMARSGRGWLWPLAVVLVLAGGGVLIWRGVVPLDRLRQLPGEKQPAAPSETSRRGRARGDSVMARDTAGFRRPAPARPAAEVPFAPTLVLPQVPLTLPAGVTLTRQLYVVKGLRIESVVPDSSGVAVGYHLVQILPSGGRIVLDELPSDSAVAGEIGVTGIEPDTVVGHTGAGGLSVTLKGLISEDMVIQLLQQLVPIGP